MTLIIHCVLLVALPLRAFAQAAVEPRLAFIRWIEQFVPYSKAAGEDASGPLGAAGQMPICTELMKDHYAPTATLTAMAGGQVTGVFTPSMLPMADCQFFGSVTHNPENRGLKAVVKVEHCKGVWRGSFPPFQSAKSNALGADSNTLETMERGFVIWGKIDDIGRFQATKDVTCFGPCLGLEGVNYTWDCPPQTDTPMPFDTDAERNAAFTRWIHEFVPYSKTAKEDASGALGAAGQMPLCTELMKDHYAATATLTAMAGGKVTGVFTPSMLPMADCQFFGSVTHDPTNSGAKSVVSVESCNGVWRGSFPPFQSATSNALGADANTLETMERGFVIEGRLDAIGRFQATKDITCFGQCMGLEGVNYTWPCGGAKSTMQTCGDIKKEYQAQNCCGSPAKQFETKKLAPTMMVDYSQTMGGLYIGDKSLSLPSECLPPFPSNGGFLNTKVPDYCCDNAPMVAPASALFPVTDEVNCPAFKFGDVYRGKAYLGCENGAPTWAEKCGRTWHIDEQESPNLSAEMQWADSYRTCGSGCEYFANGPGCFRIFAMEDVGAWIQKNHPNLLTSAQLQVLLGDISKYFMKLPAKCIANAKSTGNMRRLRETVAEEADMRMLFNLEDSLLRAKAEGGQGAVQKVLEKVQELTMRFQTQM